MYFFKYHNLPIANDDFMIFGAKILYEKCARKMLIKLTADC